MKYAIVILVCLLSLVGCKGEDSARAPKEPSARQIALAAARRAVAEMEASRPQSQPKPRRPAPAPQPTPKKPPPQAPKRGPAPPLAHVLARRAAEDIIRRRYSYDRGLLREFQRAAGVKVDGVYGGGTAGALRYWLLGPPPPKPLFAPTKETPYSPR